MTNRATHIDIAKGISIVLVAGYHSNIQYSGVFIFDLMSLCRMPLFFFMAGIFFKPSENNFEFIKNKFNGLLRPYFFTQFVLLVFSFLINNDKIFWQLKGVFYGNSHTILNGWQPLWFLPHLFAVYIASQLLYKAFDFDNFNFGIKLIYILILCIVGLNFYDTFWYKSFNIFGKAVELPGLPFTVDVLPISMAFFLIGSALKKNLINFKFNASYFAPSLIGYILIIYLTNAKIDLSQHVLIPPLYAISGAFFGIYLVISIASIFAQYRSIELIFNTLGRSSIFILIFHYIIFISVIGFFSTNMEFMPKILQTAIALLLSISVPLLIRRVILSNKLLSWAYI